MYLTYLGWEKNLWKVREETEGCYAKDKSEYLW